MADPEHPVESARQDREKFKKQVERKEQRKIEMLRHGKESVWFGLGMFGVVGWSVAIPTLLGIALGIWLDKRWQQGQVSWTLTFLVVGISLGCLNAWYWVIRERENIYKGDKRDRKNHHE